MTSFDVFSEPNSADFKRSNFRLDLMSGTVETVSDPLGGAHLVAVILRTRFAVKPNVDNPVSTRVVRGGGGQFIDTRVSVTRTAKTFASIYIPF